MKYAGLKANYIIRHRENSENLEEFTESEVTLLINYKDHHVNEFSEITSVLRTKQVKIYLDENEIQHLIEGLKEIKGEIKRIKQDAENN